MPVNQDAGLPSGHGLPAPDAAQDPPPVDFDAAVAARRRQAGFTPEEADSPHRGLALSGGGIRSATFCFGLVRALAANRVLRRFDYLSTVSGGGYFGCALGRLYDGTLPAAEVERGLARKDTLLLWWLRSNGRYLTPAGARDLAQAFASILRGILSTHFEVGMLLMLLAGTLLVLPYVLLQAVAGGSWAPWAASFHAASFSLWLWLAAVPVVLGAHHIFGYWFVRRDPRSGQLLVEGLVAAAGALVGWSWGRQVLGQFAHGPPAALAPALASALGYLLLFTPATALLWRWLRGAPTDSAARLEHTKGLSAALWLLAGMLLLALLDRASWSLAHWFAQPGTPASLKALVVALPAPLVAVARVALPRLKKWMDRAQTRPVKAETALNLLGLAFLVLLALAWATAFQFFAVALPWQWLADRLPAAGPLATLSCKLALLLGLPALYIVLTSRDLQVLNLSSLHNFYRARIERAYVACGNAARFAAGALSKASRHATEAARSLRESVPGDDVAMADYRPHAAGGPLHLLNCCINQTVDDRTQNYNADRKGVSLTVSSFGAETGAQLPRAGGPPVPGSLSTWAAISGAAASSGMGSQTAPGLAALLFLTGLRLGYWQDNLAPEPGKKPRRLSRRQLVEAEALARFPGLRSGQWYLSDGGHFENTGVYPLLKRRVKLMVVADCGADPDYRFADLENLVRKAQIDYGADISFIAPPPPAQDAPPAEMALRASLGRPGDMKRGQEGPSLLLGRVVYGPNEVATLVVVKPALVPGMRLDLAAYARRNDPFPQQPTGDQFFDEEQWEAYHQLGLVIGAQLTEDKLALLRTWAEA